MPPGISIPPHHDTGYWVSYTHRMHLAVVTSPEHIAFRVGLCEERMERFNFNPGDLVELNNQAKHSVDNCWNQHRVHLIFDYVEDYPIERIRLKVSMKEIRNLPSRKSLTSVCGGSLGSG
jgi:hypothetical protein